MPENDVQINADNACTGLESNAMHRYINGLMVCAGLRGGIGESELLCFTTLLAEITQMIGSTFTVTNYPLGFGTGEKTNGNGSHTNTSKKIS